MRVVRLRTEAERVEARRRALGIDDAWLAAARNRGKARTETKRQLLKAIEEEAQRQREFPPFLGRY